MTRWIRKVLRKLKRFVEWLFKIKFCWKLYVLENQKGECLYFETREDAERFQQFCWTYMDETGVGNGYSAYWTYTDLPVFFSIVRKKNLASNRINKEWLDQMVWRIFAVRTGQGKRLVYGDCTLIGGELIHFEIEKFPDAETPKVGDMYRIPRSKMLELDTPEGSRYAEGRVVGDNGDKLVIASYIDFDNDGIKVGARLIEIEKIRAIKIQDWLKNIYYT